ncbi:MAG: response regulator, partial [Chlorobium sp.]
FYVIDSGIGIPMEMQHKIFERFRQVNNSLTRAHEGAGLGLSITKAFVELLGGTLSVSSVEGAGSTFTFSLPYHPKQLAIPSLEDQPAASVADLTILIAEDDDVSSMLLKKNLTGDNISLLFAVNGWEAVELVEHHPEINVVLMDIKMPLMNGFEATKLIKKIRPDLPVIAQTAFTSKDDREKALEAGCDSFITKPIKKKELLSLVQELLHH